MAYASRHSVASIRSSALGPAVVASLFACFAWNGWRKWPDLIVDFGRDAYTPWRLSEGAVLYRDLVSFKGPLASYVNAASFAMFGTSLTTLFVTGLAIAGAAAALIYAIFVEACDRLTATLAATLFVTLAFYRPFSNSTWAAPYNQDLTYGLLCDVAAVYALARLARDLAGGRVRWAAAAGFLVGLAFLTKPETSLAAAVVAGAAFGALGLAAARRREPRRFAPLARAAAAAAGAALLPLVASFAFFRVSTLEAGPAARAVAGAWMPVLSGRMADDQFYAVLSGMDAPGPHALRLGLHLALAMAWLTGIGFLACAGRWQRLARWPRAAAWIAPAAVTIDALFRVRHRSQVLPWGSESNLPWESALYALPVVVASCTGGLLLSLERSTRGGKLDARRLSLLLWSALALTLISKIALNVRLNLYGIFLGMPGVVLLAPLLVHLVPGFLAGAAERAALRRAGAATIAIVLVVAIGVSLHWYRGKKLTIAAGGDRILVHPGHVDLRNPVFARALARIEAVVPPDATMVVLPEGVLLNYLARRVSPTAYVSFLPPELSATGAASVLAAFNAHPPDFVVLVHRDMPEYRVSLFGGADFGKEILDWVRAHYVPVATIGDPPLVEGSRFGITILERADPGLGQRRKLPDRAARQDLIDLDRGDASVRNAR